MTEYLPKHTQIVPEFNLLLLKELYSEERKKGVSSSLVTMTNDSRQRETGGATESRAMSSPVKVFDGVNAPSPSIKIRRPIVS